MADAVDRASAVPMHVSEKANGLRLVGGRTDSGVVRGEFLSTSGAADAGQRLHLHDRPTTRRVALH